MNGFVRINGINLKFKEEGNGKEILLVHGLNSNYTFLKKLIHGLSKNYRCLALNLPRYGKHKTEDYIKILKEFIKIKKLKDPFLIGHSLGGILCLKLINEKVKYGGLVMICTPLIEKAPKITIGLLDIMNCVVRKGIMKSYLIGFSDITHGKIQVPKAKINKPFLIIYGNHDWMIKIARGENYKKFNLDKVVYGNFGHGAPFFNSKKLIKILNEFLNKNR